MRVDVVRSLPDLLDLEEQWTAAVAQHPARTIHLSFPWLRAWWEAFGATRRMCLLVARAGDRVLGVAPLMIETRTVGWLKAPVLRLVGNDLSPRSDIVLVDRKADVMAAFVQTMATLPWLCFDFGQVPARSEALGLLTRHVGTDFASMQLRHAYRVAAVSLQGSWAGFLAGKSRNFRRSLRRAGLTAGAEVVRSFPEDFDEFDRMVGDVRRVSEETWAHREGTSLAASEPDWAFYERVMRTARDEGRLSVMFACEGAVPVAFLILVGHDDVLYALKTGYRESSGDSAPGLRLMAACLEREFVRQRWRRLDLDCMTTHSDWKHRWLTETEEVVSHYLFRRRSLSRAAAGLYRGKRWLDRWRGRRVVTSGAGDGGAAPP